jgi:hypothetical protein
MASNRWNLRCAAALSFVATAIVDHASGAEKKSFSHAQICKAGIAAIAGRDPTIVKVDRAQMDAIYLSYVWPTDGKRWAYKCKIQGDKIISGADAGRWRTHRDDSVITFNVQGSTLIGVERFGDGSSNRKMFTAQQLGG